MSKVQIQIVTWNSRAHLERLFLGIEKQTGVDFSVVVIDNASTDGTVKWLGQNFNVVSSLARNPLYNDINKNKGPLPNVEATKDVVLIKNQTNRGFAAAHNQGLAVCQAPYVLALNPDTELQAGYLEEVLRVIESDSKVASVQGKLYRELPEGEKYGIIDSCGLKMKSWGEVVDIGQNQLDTGNFETHDHPQPLLGKGGDIFGATGACALYRLEALKSVQDKHGIFDERFGSYKEDVDLAWRLQRAGWKAVFTPRAVAWHGRGVGRGDKRSWRIRFLSWRNQVLMLIKNLL
ncbi:MAG: hypothetical protein A3H70_02680 [Candidatus Komeilibacteria bacterium RIFCSPLOWO2_02_FULL_48_11]|uniref:Glycosyltransferase 2-like domain-containing protein n=1 Tax=Candidatus Komeilibacteria bacterium RIFCSPLOWO2_02_FULL_48_11 TaxID=1798553 RepID=A0A1G2BQH7_9BACT|nr:MAG: hypothetical protein A3H70_02680 [Candidatus Komeilibacteria bacterium RIFCSPLOWO2_02_FULL_48_11]